VTVLQAKGIDAKRLQSVGMGDTQPADSANTDAARAANRRVEIEVTGAGTEPAASPASAASAPTSK
jgi:flagellar motor protein MotB